MFSSSFAPTLAPKSRGLRRSFRALAAGFALLTLSCSSGSGGDDQSAPGDGGDDGQSASGILTLSGPDTASIGTEFVIGDGAREVDPGVSTAHIFLDAPKMFTATEFGSGEFNPGEDIIGLDLQNMTIFIVVTDGFDSPLGLSINFIANGIPHRYSCSAIAGAGGQNCGDLVFDEAAGEIRFNGVIVEPSTGPDEGATALLTIDGIITLNE